jgi:hypothetical protein
MKTVVLDVPELAMVVATRAALAAGIALWLSERLPVERRRAIGGALFAVGAATTIPAVLAVVRGMRRSTRRLQPGVAFDAGLIGVTRYPRKGDDIG